MKYKLIEEDDEGKMINDIELTKFEFKSALVTHKRFEQRKSR